MTTEAKVNKGRLSCKRGDYCVGKAVDLSDPTWQSRAQEYRRKLSAAMRPLSPQNIFDIPRARSMYAVEKYDGEFTFLFFDGEELISVNPGGTVRRGLPCYIEAQKLLKKAKVKSCVLAGELYALGDIGNRNRVQEIVKLLRNPTSDAELKRIGLAVFDVVEANGKPVETAAETFKLLDKWLNKGKLAHSAAHVVANKPDDISAAFTDWAIGEGAEGVVVRHDRLGYYKIKLRHNLDAAVIGFSEGMDRRKGILHDLLVAVMREDGTYHETARVGGGFTEEDRRTVFNELKKRIVPSEYVAVNNDYVAYEMVEPGPVVEISFLDLIPESSKGDPVKRMVLDWDGTQFRALSRMPLASVISPQFVRFRDDKEANVEDVNIRQITNLVKIPDANKPARAEAKAPSKMLERIVYKKTMRGASMVRKLLLWKTNKEDTGDFPGYVVYLTDFSPNRQEPLQREIKISNDEKTARRLFSDMAKKYFVGGWEKVA
jgi:ATP-dependent DNA ligase